MILCIKRLSQLRREGCSNCNTLNNISYAFSLEAVECERLLFC